MKRLILTPQEAADIAALKAGERIVVRRKIKPKPFCGPSKSSDSGKWYILTCAGAPWTEIRCPYPVGTEVWCAETFVIETNFNIVDYPPPFNDERPIRRHENFDYGPWWEQPHYRATDPTPDLAYDDLDEPHCRWVPSVRMPQWASRSRIVCRGVEVDDNEWVYTMEKM